jgi:hypothetical protein
LSSSGFVADLEAFARKAGLRTDVVCRKIALDVFGRVIMRTPVDTGRARGAWQTTIGAPAEGNRSPRRREAGAIADMHRRVREWNPEETAIFLTNNLPYIGVLENGRVGKRGSEQAPNGMVAVTLSEYPNIVRVASRGDA